MRAALVRLVDRLRDGPADRRRGPCPSDRTGRPLPAVGLFAALVLCAGPIAQADTPMLAPLVAAPDAAPPPPWTVVPLPRQTRPVTRFTGVQFDGAPALRIDADKAYGTLVHPLPPDQAAGARTLAWRWRVDAALPQADLRARSGDDTVVKVCTLFDEPRDKVPVSERMWLKAAEALANTDAPTATLCYVWDPHLAVGTVLPSPFTRRVRYLVLRSGDTPLATWARESRDIGADFLRAFGDEVKEVPRLMGVMLGGDADNTQGHGIAHVADLVLGR